MVENESKPLEFIEEFVWTPKDEVAFFQAAEDCKPKGPGKWFQMATICDNFYSYTGQLVSTKVLWDHLNTMYNLEALEDSENKLFSSAEYQLPVQEFELTELLNERKEKTEEKTVPAKVVKDYSRKKEAIKKEEVELAIVDKTLAKSKTELFDDSDEDDTPLKPSKQIIKIKQEEKPGKTPARKSVARARSGTPKRTTRNTREKVDEPSPAGKSDENDLASISTKKTKSSVGKRSLRSRDDKSSSPAPTAPPAKRARRI